MKDLESRKQDKGSFTGQKSRLLIAGLLSSRGWLGSIGQVT